MKKIIFILVAGFLLAPLTSFSQTEGEIQKMYQKFLKKRGYDSEIDSDGDVRFEHEGKIYFMEVNEDDPEFFRLVLANIWPVESDMERIEVWAACNEATAQVKVCKAYETNDNVWISYELFLEEVDDFEPLFDRGMQTIELTTDIFVTEMRSE